jgi:ceramide glucosyltransferase
VLADVVVETSLGAGSWRDVWKHQIRWSRTIRVSRPAGYFGYLVTQLTFWSIMAGAFGYERVALAGILVRLIAARAALIALGEPSLMRAALAPLRDLPGFAVWAGGMVGREVEWRGLRYRLLSDGKISALPNQN